MYEHHDQPLNKKSAPTSQDVMYLIAQRQSLFGLELDTHDLHKVFRFLNYVQINWRSSFRCLHLGWGGEGEEYPQPYQASSRGDGYNLTRFGSPEPGLIFTNRKNYMGSLPTSLSRSGVPGGKAKVLGSSKGL